MCGRYTLHANKKQLAEAIALALPTDYAPDYNIGPGRETLAIANRDPEHTVTTLMHWGLRTPQNFHVNSRLETADTAPRFRESWAAQRCLLPANGFYEWYQDGVTKQPYYIYPADSQLIYFAGLWFAPLTEGAPATCVILTTAAQASIREIHDRMPLMLPPQAHADWLGNTLNKAQARELAAEIPLQRHTISRRVNSTQNRDSRLIEATSPLVDDQMMLF